MSLTIDKNNDSDFKDTIFNLDEASVNSATVNPTDDASVLLRTLVLKMFQKKIKDTRKFKKEYIKRDFRILMSLTEKDFQSKEEYETYEKYMKILIEKALKLPVVETINAMESNFSAKKGAAVFELFGPDKDNSIVNNLIKKKVTFEQLLLPAYLGQTYEGKGSKVMDKVDKNKSLFDANKIDDYRTSNDEIDRSGRVSYTWDLEAYLISLLEDDGITADPNMGDSPLTYEHFQYIENDKKNETVTLNKIKFDDFVLKGKPNKLEISYGMDSKPPHDEIPLTYNIHEKKYEVNESGGRNDAISYLHTLLDLDDEQLDKIAIYLLERSNFMVARRIRDRDKKTRGQDPSLSELTRNYLDLDVGKMTLVVSISNYKPLKSGKIKPSESTTGKEEDRGSLSVEEKTILNYSLILNKEGELRLAEEGAFVVADKDKIKGISDILKGVKTFMAKARRFRS